MRRFQSFVTNILLFWSFPKQRPFTSTNKSTSVSRAAKNSNQRRRTITTSRCTKQISTTNATYVTHASNPFTIYGVTWKSTLTWKITFVQFAPLVSNGRSNFDDTYECMTESDFHVRCVLAWVLWIKVIWRSITNEFISEFGTDVMFVIRSMGARSMWYNIKRHRNVIGRSGRDSCRKMQWKSSALTSLNKFLFWTI